MIKPNVIILLSTYNGERFIKQQLDSLLAQTYPAQILIRDDGSNDGTLAILGDYAKRHTSIYLFTDSKDHKGLRGSYFWLLTKAQAFFPDVICYADQDDVWLPDKTEKLFKQLLTIDHQKPALVFSDVTVVDENLNLIHPSLATLQKLDHDHKITLKKLLLYCPALGCTLMMNKPLVKLICDLPHHGHSLNPDKWALMLAYLSGSITYLPEPTVKYRQHSSNTVGAMLGIKRNIWNVKNIGFLKNRYQVALDQALEISHISFLSAKEKEVVVQFIKFFTGNYRQRLRYFFSFIGAPPSLKRKCGLLFSLGFHFTNKERYLVK